MSTISASTTTTTAFGVTADTTGALVFQTGASPTTALTLDTSQNVGIGTTSPTVKLDLVGDFNQTGSNTRIRSKKTGGTDIAQLGNGVLTGDPNGYGITTMGAYPLIFGTNATETMRINSSGNVGIGTSGNIPYKLSVNGSITDFLGYYYNTDTSTSSQGVAITTNTDNGATKYRWDTGATLYLSNDRYQTSGIVSKIVMNTANGGYNNGAIIHVEGAGANNRGELVFSTGWDASALATERMRINSSGNVGIGTSSPSAPLDVRGTSGLIRTTSTTGTNTTNIGFTNTGGSFYIGLDSSTGGNFGAGNYGALLYNGANTPMVMFTNGTERARIDSSGNLLAYKTMQITTSSSGTYGTATFYTRLTSGTAYTIATGTGLNNDTVVTATLEYVNLYNYSTASDWAYGLRQAALRGSTGGATSAGNNAINNQTNGGAANAPTFLWTGASPISLTVTNSSSVEGWARVTVSWRDVTMSFNPVA